MHTADWKNQAEKVAICIIALQNYGKHKSINLVQKSMIDRSWERRKC